MPVNANAQNIDETYYRSITSLIYNTTNNGTAPWLHEHKENEQVIPHNPITGRLFSGVNGLYLNMVASENNYKDPRWITIEEMHKSGGKITPKYGEKAIILSLHNKYSPREKDNTTSIQQKYVMVFNAEQLRGLPPYEHNKNHERIEERQLNLSKNLGTSVDELKEALSKSKGLYSTLPATSRAISQYLICQDLEKPYIPPINKEEAREELKTTLSSYSIETRPSYLLKAAFYATAAKERLLNYDSQLEIDKTRTVQYDKTKSREVGLGY